MSPFLVLAKARELHQQYNRACEETREILRTFYRRFDRTGALPLGLLGKEYCWVVFHGGQFPADGCETQHAFIAANTPGGLPVRVIAL
jgi:hypothetical protein